MKASSIIVNIWEGKHSCVGRSVYTCREREKVPNTNDFFMIQKISIQYWTQQLTFKLRQNSERLISYVGKLKPFMKTN